MRPMKGVKVEDKELHKIIWPMWGSPKMDGIRCEMWRLQCLSASLKRIPNRFVRSVLEGNLEFEGFDGELCLRDLSIPFNDVQSAIMSQDGEPDFVYLVFDYIPWGGTSVNTMFTDRLNCLLADGTFDQYSDRIARVPHVYLEDVDQMKAYEEKCLNEGYEGIMLRRPDLPYKFGKASINQQNMLKRKPVVESECIVYGFEEQQENTNELEQNEMGLAKRSSSKEGKVGKGTLGKFLVWNEKFGEFKIGTGRGLTKELRQLIWDNVEDYFGKVINFVYQEIGTVDKPRQPIYRYFRDERDVDLDLMFTLRGGLGKIIEKRVKEGLPYILKTSSCVD